MRLNWLRRLNRVEKIFHLYDKIVVLTKSLKSKLSSVYPEYKNKFVRVHGKISKISGNESIELASYTSSEESLNGYVNFNLDYTLNVKSNEILSSYRIYDYIDVIGRVDSYKNNNNYSYFCDIIFGDSNNKGYGKKYEL